MACIHEPIEPATRAEGLRTTPSGEDNSYCVLIGNKPNLGLFMALNMFPLEGEDMTLYEILAQVDAAKKMGILDRTISMSAGEEVHLDELEAEIIDRNGRKMV